MLQRFAPFFILLVAAGGDGPPDYRRWLQEEVAYIVSRTEKQEFETLSDDAAREAFVESFWQRRDPDPATEANPVREEHYRRLDYANRYFQDGRAGWRTDRGRIYVIHGEPDARLVFPSEELSRKRELALNTGETVAAATSGYSGVTISIPEAELWTYRPRPGRRLSELTDILFMRVDESDVLQLLTVQKPGQRYLERNEFYSSGLYRGAGGMGRAFRMVYTGRPRFNSNLDFYRALEHSPNSFQAPEMNQARAELLRSPGDLLEKELQLRRHVRSDVEAAVFFDPLPVSVQHWFLPAQQPYTRIPLAVHLPPEAFSGVGELAVLIEARRQGRVVAEVIDQVRLRGQTAPRQGLTYQTQLVTRPGAHQLVIHVLDRENGRFGRTRTRLEVPQLDAATFQVSPIMLCGRVESLDPEAAEQRPWSRLSTPGATMGPWLVDGWLLAPQPRAQFRRKDTLTAYFEIFAPALRDQRPQVEVQLQLVRDGAEPTALESRQLEYLTLDSQPKVSYALSISLSRLSPGRYRLSIRAHDTIAGRTAQRSEAFEIL